MKVSCLAEWSGLRWTRHTLWKRERLIYKFPKGSKYVLWLTIWVRPDLPSIQDDLGKLHNLVLTTRSISKCYTPIESTHTSHTVTHTCKQHSPWCQNSFPRVTNRHNKKGLCRHTVTAGISFATLWWTQEATQHRRLRRPQYWRHRSPQDLLSWFSHISHRPLCPSRRHGWPNELLYIECFTTVEMSALWKNSCMAIKHRKALPANVCNSKLSIGPYSFSQDIWSFNLWIKRINIMSFTSLSTRRSASHIALPSRF